MQKLLHKSIAVFTACALAVGMVTLPIGADEAQAATKTTKTTTTKKTTKTTAAKKTSKAVMAKLKLKWTLKKNKKFTITEPYAGVGAKKSNVLMKNYKVRNAKNKPGYKTVSFDVVKTLAWTPTKKQVHKMMDTNYYVDTKSVGGGVYIAVVDRTTGRSLAVSNNKQKVEVRSTTWKTSSPTKWITDEDKCHSLALDRKMKIHVAITYPASYKGLCIGIGGYNKKAETKADKQFWQGKVAFSKTSFYKNAKTKSGKKLNSYWMRVK
ncbi:hypothetical protein [uncultured Adlercreutzia sp.]|uniref:hypothetical protein n=1 Tax=uncultured Adlercreutzia sp. TaxID=875803 RepID=UPI0025F61B67|nr:hypothetical protein [uncultured Adlercreutzia sp.]MCI9260941.1 hypothetical protein [Eggerthellaceae bacterium]